MDLQNNVDASIAARTEKAEAKAKNLQAAAEAKGDLEDTSTTRDDDSKFLADTSSQCGGQGQELAGRGRGEGRPRGHQHNTRRRFQVLGGHQLSMRRPRPRTCRPRPRRRATSRTP